MWTSRPTPALIIPVLSNFESKFAVETCEAPKTVESAVNVIWKGATLMTPIGGGVQIHPTKAIQENYLLKDEKGAVAKVRKTARNPSGNASPCKSRASWNSRTDDC